MNLKLESILNPYIQWRTLEIVLNDDKKGHEYRVDLERCTTPAEMLDWIFQINSKPWCDAEMISRFLGCLEEACEKKFGRCVQGAFCPDGIPLKVNWNTGEVMRTL